MLARAARLALLLVLAGARAVSALAAEDGIALSLPIDCEPGQSCWIMNYADTDPGPGAQDFACGPRTYDGHGGTDFGLRDLAAMAEGVAVLAAAPGEVIGVRDEMPDVSSREVGTDVLQGKLCGNGVRLDHGGGWRTQYCHMKRGSIRVQVGERVERGQVLGEVGLSGRTEFPHLHLSVTFAGNKVDPFRGRSPGEDCGLGQSPLWLAALLPGLAYQPLVVFNAGFAGGAVEGGKILAGAYRNPDLDVNAAALVFWFDSLGVRQGDRLTLRLTGPEGPVAENSEVIEADKARRWGFVGRKRRGEAWPPGLYRGEAEILRRSPDGTLRRHISRQVTLK